MAAAKPWPELQGAKLMNAHELQAPGPTDTEAVALRHLIMSFRATQLISVAAKLGIADLLQPGPQTPQVLAQAVGTERRRSTACCASWRAWALLQRRQRVTLR
jgi:hypothetical protein